MGDIDMVDTAHEAIWCRIAASRNGFGTFGMKLDDFIESLIATAKR